MIRLVIPGKPIAKKRPRFYRRGKGVGTYNDQETEEGRFVLEVKNQLRRLIGGHSGADLLPLDGPIQLHCIFDMYIPKSTSKKKRKAMLSGEIWHIKRPDLSNLVKFVEDCLNKVVWKDDSQIITLMSVKRYSEEPKTVVVIHEEEI